ncbi:hypothetical protein AQUSIP_00170 [Aquicella siphonis]|uniref:Uncharacterized protein n=1 Tax=Aquicella siphonis TaxID=254247 RepID=A0A5E4PDT1_9COXI|nr:hypothetical protein [Aquicella siphonis]VVC74745.1 hypothetical protein AQUSIP_00170 [Aquicella siphonis]
MFGRHKKHDKESADHKDKTEKKDKKSKKAHTRVAVIGTPVDSGESATPNPQLLKLDSIQQGISEMTLDMTLKQPALDKIAAIRILIQTSAERAAIVREIKELDEMVLGLRYQAVEKKKEQLLGNIQEVMDHSENMNDLHKKAADLQELTHDAFKPRQTQPAKKRGGFFSCFPCCGGNDADDDEHQPLIRHHM